MCSSLVSTWQRKKSKTKRHEDYFPSNDVGVPPVPRGRRSAPAGHHSQETFPRREATREHQLRPVQLRQERLRKTNQSSKEECCKLRNVVTLSICYICWRKEGRLL
ncbi:uncharacterized protein LOC125027941 isoform X2 [Penaeus chinensis]|uniref:uncharacterized protein LOC125027941 isoform X2 n=1 Tax=Penaeus chinensis TaxID=139456 RepID=UPI001FB5E590|nr:uncharacterized protein LOC125027941 isoform X2 [Penaeus chinensis]